MESEQDLCLCCGQRGSMWADIKVQSVHRDERGKVWEPYKKQERRNGEKNMTECESSERGSSF